MRFKFSYAYEDLLIDESAIRPISDETPPSIHIIQTTIGQWKNNSMAQTNLPPSITTVDLSGRYLNKPSTDHKNFITLRIYIRSISKIVFFPPTVGSSIIRSPFNLHRSIFQPLIPVSFITLACVSGGAFVLRDSPWPTSGDKEPGFRVMGGFSPEDLRWINTLWIDDLMRFFLMEKIQLY